MFRFIKNDDGIALMMVLVLLILVGGLTASLMAAGVFNIRFGVDEVDRTKAFYAADAGVEYTKNTLIKMESEEMVDQLKDENNINKSLYQNDSNFLVDDERKINIGDSSFNVKLKDIDDKNVVFESTGFFNGVEEKIEFSFSSTDVNFEGNPILLRYLEEFGYDIEKYYEFAGNKDHDDTITEELMEIIDLFHEDEDKGFNDWYSVLDAFGLIDYDENENRIFLGEGLADGDEFGKKNDFIEEENMFTRYTGDIRGNETISSDYRFYGKEEVIIEVEIGGNITIEDSIIIVDGDINFKGNPDVRNSLIIAKNGISFGGSNEFEKSYLFSYLGGDDIYKKVSGVPATTLIPPSLDLDNGDYDLPDESKGFIKKLIALAEDSSTGALVFNSDWRQIR